MNLIASLTKSELVFLLQRFCNIDPQDIANARWEIAVETARRLESVAKEAEKAELAAIASLMRDPKNRRLIRARADAMQVSVRARESADRAYLREQRCWKALRSFAWKPVK